MRFYFDFTNWYRMLGLALRGRNPGAVARLALWIPLASSFHAVCFFLDGLLFPALHRVAVVRPVFLVGHARSGTTLAHRLLAEDEGRFSAFTLYECYLPSLLQKRAIRGLARIDQRVLGGALERRVRAWEERRYGALRGVHEMSLGSHEEDDIVLYYSCASGFWITKMPHMDELDFYHVAGLPERKRRRMMAFYRDCVRRELLLNGPERTHLSKNPLFSGRVAALLETFPDARFVILMRNPMETIPSLLALMRGSWKHLGWDEARQRRCLRILAEQSFETYRAPLEAMAARPATRHAVLDYRDLVSDPARAIERVYRDLDLPLSAAHRERLLAEGKRASEHRSSHAYALEDFGLEAAEIHRRLADLFQRFDWSTPERPS